MFLSLNYVCIYSYEAHLLVLSFDTYVTFVMICRSVFVMNFFILYFCVITYFLCAFCCIINEIKKYMFLFFHPPVNIKTMLRCTAAGFNMTF